MVDLFEDEGECREEDIEETDSTLRLYICTSLTPLVTGRVILWDGLEFESRVAWARDLRLVLSGRRDCPFFCGVWRSRRTTGYVSSITRNVVLVTIPVCKRLN
jgi:hypothetical protein